MNGKVDVLAWISSCYYMGRWHASRTRPMSSHHDVVCNHCIVSCSSLELFGCKENVCATLFFVVYYDELFIIVYVDT